MLDAASDEVGIDLDDATLQYLPIDELDVVQLAITFPVTGTYASVRRLLDELLALPLFLVIDGVGLQSFGATSSRGSDTLQVDLAVSVFLDDPELSGPAAPVAPTRPAVSADRVAAPSKATTPVTSPTPSSMAYRRCPICRWNRRR